MHLILSVEEMSKINELIKLLTPFKVVGEVLGREKDITLTCIIPMFNYLEGIVLVQDHRNDSAMIQDMKIQYSSHNLAFTLGSKMETVFRNFHCCSLYLFLCFVR